MQQVAIIIGDGTTSIRFARATAARKCNIFKQLAAQAGHDLDLTRIVPAAWIDASKASHATDYSFMADVIEPAIEG